MGQIHDAAQQGFSRESRSYARGRPEYPEEILRWLGDVLGLSATSTVLDLGAGTGKFTKLLARTGATVLAVEPVVAMREQFAFDLPAVSIWAGDAEAIPLGKASVDAVVCAQAFHWFATDAALAEIHRVLRPGGRLGLIWNVRDESVNWVAKVKGRLQDLIASHPALRGQTTIAFPYQTLAYLCDRLD